jgi:[pyruvate, water dikinase]-phosphate phosphotransferase / [pyruvate, water dikinase] kinase
MLNRRDKSNCGTIKFDLPLKLEVIRMIAVQEFEKVNIYLLSDSSGETVLYTASAVLAQFEGIYINKFMWPMVRTKAQIDSLIKVINVMHGVIMYTLVDPEIEKYLKEVCQLQGIPVVSVLGGLIEEMSQHIKGKRKRSVPGLQHKILDEDYNDRIAAIDYTISHDDGQMQKDLTKADIIIIGASRTSKSPTSLYLAQRGFKTANVPFIGGVKLDIDIPQLQNKLIVGLTIAAERLKMIRDNRLSSLSAEPKKVNNYTEISSIREELIEARKFFQENNIPVIDVTGRAIEETSAEIINLYYEKFGISSHKMV